MSPQEPDDTMKAADDPTFDDTFDEAALDALLGSPELWGEPDPIDADAIVALIAAEAEPAAPAPVVHLSAARSARAERRLAPLLLSAAAGALVVLATWAALSALGPAGVEVALEGTDLAPAATADATVDVGTLGTRILLDVTGLPPAPEGFYYEAWLRESPEVGVSAGTFHLRGGDGSVELWAGVDPADYPLLTVTLQEEAMPDSSGQVVLKGRLDIP